ncbi:unnamed protein product [Merluccius merluccius]
MVDANRRSLCNFGYAKSNPFVTINDGDVEETIDYMSEGNTSYYGLSNVFHCEVEPIKMRHAAAPCELIQPKFSSRNPFINSEEDSYCFQGGVANRQSDSCSHVHNHQPHVPPLKLHNFIPQPAAIATPHSNPFSSDQGSYIHSTPKIGCPPAWCTTCAPPALLHQKSINHGHLPEPGHGQTMTLKGSFRKGEPPKSQGAKPCSALYQPSSESEDDYDHRERVPTLRPGQYDVTTPWTEFLHRFESCAKANYWSAKTMAVQLKFCMVGAAGAIIHRNTRPAQWDYVRLVEEIETA